LRQQGCEPSRPSFLLETRGVCRDFGEHVISAAFARDAALFLLADGRAQLVSASAPDSWRQIEAFDAGGLSLCGAGAAGFLAGGDNGRVVRIGRDGTVAPFAAFGGKWVEHVAAYPGEKDRAVYAAAAGKTLRLFDAAGTALKSFDHPSTVAGLTFDAKGKRIGAAHYNGASLWFVAAKTDSPRVLEWKGSHTAIVISPDGDAVVTAMQEAALHGWRLSDGQHMRMSGYPGKTRSLSFSRNGKWLATSGADAIVLWPFFGGGPMGKSPTELASGDGVVCTAVACHPQQDMVAGGFDDGLVVLADIASARILPVAEPGHGAITALAWNADGSHLAIGSADGFAAVVDFTRRGS
jgi:WD40 repeat protein